MIEKFALKQEEDGEYVLIDNYEKRIPVILDHLFILSKQYLLRSLNDEWFTTTNNGSHGGVTAILRSMRAYHRPNFFAIRSRAFFFSTKPGWTYRSSVVAMEA